MSRLLVTGATGDVGGELTRRLVRAGEQVRVLARDPAKAAAIGPGVEVALGDLLQPETLDAAFAGVEKAFLMGPAHHLPEIAAHAAAAAERGGVRHVVLLSSSTTLMDPLLTLGKWHLDAERILEATRMGWTMLRPGYFASNTLRWAPAIKAQGSVFAPEGQGASAPIDPQDIAAVAALALTSPGHEGKRHVLTGEEVLTPKQLVDTIGAAIGKEIRFVEVPAAGARAGMARAGMSEAVIEAMMELLGSRQGGEALRSPTVREVTGAAPRTFAAWVQAHLSAFT